MQSIALNQEPSSLIEGALLLNVSYEDPEDTLRHVRNVGA